MTDEELSAIKARAEAATEGPWESVQDYYDGPWYMLYEQRCVGDDKASDLFDGRSHYLIDAPNNAAFAAHAREDIPALLAEIERMKTERRWVPVDERLPETGESVLIALPYPIIGRSCTTGGYVNHTWYCDDFGGEAEVTHWMPLPTAPGGD